MPTSGAWEKTRSPMLPENGGWAHQLTLPGNRRVRANPTEIEFRYEEQAGEYVLTAFRENVVSTGRGLIETQPQWLRDILTVARVGRHEWGDGVFWFITDSDFNLTQFISPTESPTEDDDHD